MYEFQVKPLRKELYNAGRDQNSISEKLIENREKLKQQLPNYCIPSIIIHNRYDIRLLHRIQTHIQVNQKTKKLIFVKIALFYFYVFVVSDRKRTVVCYDLNFV